MKYLFLAIIFSAAMEVAGQQTVFNVPSADVLDKAKVYVELDASFKTNNQDALRKFSSFVPRVVVGTGNNVEIGLNVTGNLNPGIDTTTLVPTVKWRFYRNEKKKSRFSAARTFIFRRAIEAISSVRMPTPRRRKPSTKHGSQPVDSSPVKTFSHRTRHAAAVSSRLNKQSMTS